MNDSVDISSGGVDWTAIVDSVSRTGTTVRLTRGTEVVAEVTPPRRRYGTVADLIDLLKHGPRLGKEEAEAFAKDLEESRREIESLGMPNRWDS
jgi:hypothetical protein